MTSKNVKYRSWTSNEWQNARRVDIFIYVARKVSCGSQWCGKSKGFVKKKIKNNETDCNYEGVGGSVLNFYKTMALEICWTVLKHGYQWHKR